MKNCYSCKLDKPKDQFAKDIHKKDGLNSYCKACKKLKKHNHIPRVKKEMRYVPEVNTWLQNNYNQLLINCKKICGAGYRYWGEDLLPFIIQELMEKPADYQLSIYNNNKLEEWITKAMAFQLKSSSSPFYYRYRLNLINERSQGLEDIEDNSDSVNEDIIMDFYEIINNMSELDKLICTELYINGKEIKETGIKYNVSIYNMKLNIARYKKIFKNQLNHHYI